MDRGVRIGERRGVGVVSTRLYRVESAILGGRRVAGGGDVGDILYQRQDRGDGVAGSHDEWCGTYKESRRGRRCWGDGDKRHESPFAG